MTIHLLLLAIWSGPLEERSWLRKLAIFAVALCVFQGVLGGARGSCSSRRTCRASTRPSASSCDAPWHAGPGPGLHLIALAIGCSRSWQERAVPVSPGLRRWGVLCCRAALRAADDRRRSCATTTPAWRSRLFRGPTPDGGLFPPVWTFKVAIHFAHRVMALVLAVALVVFASRFGATAARPWACGRAPRSWSASWPCRSSSGRR